jgi:hypothetical protein
MRCKLGESADSARHVGCRRSIEVQRQLPGPTTRNSRPARYFWPRAGRTKCGGLGPGVPERRGTVFVCEMGVFAFYLFLLVVIYKSLEQTQNVWFLSY